MRFFFRKKALGPKWTIYKKCLYVGNSGILTVVVIVVCLCPAYTSLCTGLEYLLKVRYITVVNANNGAGFLIFNTGFMGWKNTAPEKYITKMGDICVWCGIYLHQTFKNVYLVNTHIFTYRHAKCNCTSFDFYVFFARGGSMTENLFSTYSVLIQDLFSTYSVLFQDLFSTYSLLIQ